MTPLVFLDTETTGLHYDRRPWEIAMIRRDGPGQRELVIQVSDVDLTTAELIGLNIGRFYERHNGYALKKSHSKVSYLKEENAVHKVEEWTRGAHIVGAVPNFDTEVLAAMFRRHRLIPAWHYHLIDVEPLAVGYIHGAYGTKDPAERQAVSLPWKSDDLSLACGVDPPGEGERHTALGDARWAMRLYDAITNGADK